MGTELRGVVPHVEHLGAHLATKSDAERVGMLRHDQLGHVGEGEVWSD